MTKPLGLITVGRASMEVGGFWWDVAVPQVSERREVVEARAAYEKRVRERQVT